MIPPHVAEDMIRRMNIAMWAPGTHNEKVEALCAALHEFVRLYGPSRFRRISGVTVYRLRDMAAGKVRPLISTLLKIMPYLGLRARIELDPNPRHAVRPMTRRAAFEARLIKLRAKDPSGKLAQAAIEKDIADRRAAVKRVQAYFARRPEMRKPPHKR